MGIESFKVLGKRGCGDEQVVVARCASELQPHGGSRERQRMGALHGE